MNGYALDALRIICRLNAFDKPSDLRSHKWVADAKVALAKLLHAS